MQKIFYYLDKMNKFSFCQVEIFFKNYQVALAGVAQWVECRLNSQSGHMPAWVVGWGL